MIQMTVRRITLKKGLVILRGSRSKVVLRGPSWALGSGDKALADAVTLQN